MIDDTGYDDWKEGGREAFIKAEARNKMIKQLKENIQNFVDEIYQGMSERAKQGIIDANIALIDAITERD